MQWLGFPIALLGLYLILCYFGVVWDFAPLKAMDMLFANFFYPATNIEKEGNIILLIIGIIIMLVGSVLSANESK